MKIKHIYYIVIVIVILYLIYQYNTKKEKMTTEDVNTLSNQVQNQVETQTNQPTFGVYYTEWCGYSQQFLDQLKNGTGASIQKAGAKIELIDCEKDKEMCAKYNVQGFPTLLLHTSKGVVPYNGNRSGDAIAEFITQNK
jgi:thioredoxin-like negative regulator of GroEL